MIIPRILPLDDAAAAVLQQQAPSFWLLDFVFRTWWFDPFLATVSFTVFINWYWYHERKLGVSSDASFRSTLAQWSVLQNNSIVESLGPMFQSLAAYWVGIYLWTSVIPPAATEIPDGWPIGTTASSTAGAFLYLAAEVISGLFLYDAIFFSIHWAMHEIPVLRRFHARHHEQHSRTVSSSCKQITTTTTTTVKTMAPPPPVESRDVLRHSLADGTLQVLVNILCQRHTPWGTVKTRLARSLHNLLVIWMLTESHSAAPTPNVWRRCCVGVREHYQHHTAHLMSDFVLDSETDGDSRNNQQHTKRSISRCRYQQFFGYLDDLRRDRWLASNSKFE